MLLEFVQTLRQAELDLTPHEIVEALLLARFLPEAALITTKDVVALTNDLSTHEPAPTATLPPTAQSDAAAWLTLQAGADVLPSTSHSTATVLPFASPRARALPGALKITKALRPLRKRYTSSRFIEMDEEATTHQISDGGPKAIVWRPGTERWLTVELVLDVSLSMHVWRPTLQEFRRLLEQHGAFNSVNIWQLNADTAIPTLRHSFPGQYRAVTTAKLLNPNVRQLVMVVSDCTAAAWHHGEAYQWVMEWARKAKTVLVQVLPRSLWLDTSMIETDVLLSSMQPYVSNQALKVITQNGNYDYADWLRKGVALPVVTLDEAALSPWAKMIAGVSSMPVAGFILPDMSDLLVQSEAATIGTTMKPDLDATARVAGFGTASPLARELARLLAVVPISLPVVQLVQQVCLPQSRQSHLAEIFRSDLLDLPMPQYDQSFDDETIFDFHEGVRDALLSELTLRQKETEALAVLDAVENFIVARSGQSRVFSSLIIIPEGASAPLNAVQVTPLTLAFAHIGARTLRKLNVRLDKTEEWETILRHYKMSAPRPLHSAPPALASQQPQQIYALTPGGKMFDLPVGATPIDFAYAIHSEVGDQCTGAKVNGRIVPLRYLIQNGDVIEIITTRGHKPSRDWLNFVVTTKARNKIKRWIGELQRAESVEIGRRLFDKEAEKLRLKPKQVLDDPQLARFLSDNGYSKVEDMMAAIGYGKLMARGVLIRFVAPGQLAKIEQAKMSKLQQVTKYVKHALRLGEDRILIKGVDNVQVYRAPCCKPIRGEEIIGYITRGKGVSVHARRCKNVANLLTNRDRVVKVNWVGSESKGDGKPDQYAVKLVVTIEDRQGMLAVLTKAIANTNANIRNAHHEIVNDGSRQIDFTVETTDVKHLNRIIDALKEVEGVLSVERSL